MILLKKGTKFIMILKAKESVGVMPPSVIKDYGISPVAGIENEKVWPKFENGSFCIVKDEKYNVTKNHPFFEGSEKLPSFRKKDDKVSGGKTISDDDSPSSNKGSRSGG